MQEETDHFYKIRKPFWKTKCPKCKCVGVMAHGGLVSCSNGHYWYQIMNDTKPN